ncbi:MAG: NYN domain-containing protein [Ilumatobacteraceae bacterium]
MLSHVVVDGSNIATEGRSQPSLQQLHEAVLAFVAEHPAAKITVVVDATFGHRIDPKEVAEFDAAVANNELVAPPAGAIGRGDAFVLSIAHKVNASILSNDSYQEFHGQYAWLFDEGRLIGGKPVPHVGWVFVNRLPVRGPLSRKSLSAAKKQKAPRPSAAASKPMPVPTALPPGAVLKASRSTSNDLGQFLSFVEHHPVGSSVNAVVDHYSSHGAYVRIGDVLGYVPLRLMSDPPPRSAREFMKVGESVTLVVDSFVPTKRSIDLATPEMVVDRTTPTKKKVPVTKATAKKATAKKAPAKKQAPAKKAPAKKATAKKAPAKKASTKKSAAPRARRT